MIKRTPKLVILIAILLASSANSPAQREGFVPVDGPNLRSKLDTAVRQARARQTRFWTAYAFDVRPGVAVDVEWHNGTTTIASGTSISIGSKGETRNLGVFVLHEPSERGAPTCEVYSCADCAGDAECQESRTCAAISRMMRRDLRPGTPSCAVVRPPQLAPTQRPRATLVRMESEEVAKLREEIRNATRKYRRTEKAHEQAREELIAAIVNGLRNGVRPAEVEDDSPFKGASIRRIRDDHGIPAFKKGQPASPAGDPE